MEVYERYYKAMYNISLRIVNDPMEAEDIMQESFLSAFEEIGKYSGTVSFGAWLNRFNDTLATTLESGAADVARQIIGPKGWSTGKHAPVPDQE